MDMGLEDYKISRRQANRGLAGLIVGLSGIAKVGTLFYTPRETKASGTRTVNVYDDPAFGQWTEDTSWPSMNIGGSLYLDFANNVMAGAGTKLGIFAYTDDLYETLLSVLDIVDGVAGNPPRILGKTVYVSPQHLLPDDLFKTVSAVPIEFDEQGQVMRWRYMPTRVAPNTPPNRLPIWDPYGTVSILQEANLKYGDVNNDGIVNLQDFAKFAEKFNVSSSDMDLVARILDANSDDAVNLGDFAEFALNFNTVSWPN